MRPLDGSSPNLELGVTAKRPGESNGSHGSPMISSPQVLRIRLPETPPASPPDVKRPPRLSPRRAGYSPGDEFDLPLRLRSPLALGTSSGAVSGGALAVTSSRSTSVQTDEAEDSRQTENPVQYLSMATQTDKVCIIPGTPTTAEPQFLLSSRALSGADTWDQSSEEKAPSTPSPPSSPTAADQPKSPCLSGKPVSATEIESLAARIAAYDLSSPQEVRNPACTVPQIDWQSGAAEFWKGHVEPLAVLLGGRGGRDGGIVISAGDLGPPWKAVAEIRGRLPDVMFRYVLPASYGAGGDGDDGWEDIAEDNSVETSTVPVAKKRRRAQQNFCGGGCREKRRKVATSYNVLAAVSPHTLEGHEAAGSEDRSEWTIELDLPGWELGSLW